MYHWFSSVSTTNKIPCWHETTSWKFQTRKLPNGQNAASSSSKLDEFIIPVFTQNSNQCMTPLLFHNFEVAHKTHETTNSRSVLSFGMLFSHLYTYAKNGFLSIQPPTSLFSLHRYYLRSPLFVGTNYSKFDRYEF